jgi:hypothetical protein
MNEMKKKTVMYGGEVYHVTFQSVQPSGIFQATNIVESVVKAGDTENSVLSLPEDVFNHIVSDIQ